MSLHTCPQCGYEVATNSTTAGAFSVPPNIVCVKCSAQMEADPDVTVDMDRIA